MGFVSGCLVSFAGGTGNGASRGNDDGTLVGDAGRKLAAGVKLGSLASCGFHLKLISCKENPTV